MVRQTDTHYILHCTEHTLGRLRISIVMRHAAEHGVRPIGILTRFLVIEPCVMSHADTALHIPLRQLLVVKELRGKIDYTHQHKGNNSHHVRPRLLPNLFPVNFIHSAYYFPIAVFKMLNIFSEGIMPSWG